MKQNERDVLKISKTETGRIRNNKNKIQKEKANGLPKTLNQDPVIHPHIYLRLKNRHEYQRNTIHNAMSKLLNNKHRCKASTHTHQNKHL